MYEQHIPCTIIYALITFQSCIISTVIFIKVKRTPTVYSMLAIQFLLVWRLFFGIIEVQSETTEEMLLAARISLFSGAFIGAAWFIFTLFYIGYLNRKRMWMILLILLPSVATYWPVFTEKYFYLTIIEKEIETHGDTVWGILGVANFSITYSYALISLAILTAHSIKNYKKLEGKVLLIVGGVLAIILTNLLSVFKVFGNVGFDLTPVSYGLFSLILSIAVFRFDFFDVLRDAAIDMFYKADDAIMVLDDKHFIVEYNHKMLSTFNGIIRPEESTHIELFFQRLELFTPSKDQLYETLMTTGTSKDIQIVIKGLGQISKKTYYDVEMRRISSNEGRAGSTLIFKDRTQSAENFINQERNRISMDIHDNLSNMINVVSMNLEYAKSHYDNKEQVLASIDTAYASANSIRMNLRRILEELDPSDISKVGFLNAIEGMLKKTSGTDVHVEFTHSGVNDGLISQSIYGYVLYKTCMEGINNAYFSGQAEHISIVLTQTKESLRLLISDDGKGCEILHKGRGLTAMEDRIHQVGGIIQFDTTPGEGFNIGVTIDLT